MNSHTRIQCTPNLIAIQQLECSTYKILMYLAARSNQYGVCYPLPKTIAQDAGLCATTVYSALDELSSNGYIKYLRKAFYNRFTNESINAIFQVSPYFLEIAFDFQNDAFEMWHENGNVKISLSNQQQELPSQSNSINQLQETTTTTKNSKSDSDEKPRKANREKQTATAQQTAQQTNSAPQQKSESSAIVKKFTNPTGIAQPLPDALSEKLAERLNVWKIPMPLARGLIFKFGYDNVDRAANYTEFCSKMQDIQTMAGFFRTTLETNTHDIELVESVDKKRKEYDDLFDS